MLSRAKTDRHGSEFHAGHLVSKKRFSGIKNETLFIFTNKPHNTLIIPLKKIKIKTVFKILSALLYRQQRKKSKEPRDKPKGFGYRRVYLKDFGIGGKTNG